MNFTQAVSQIKERVDLVEYIGRYVALKRFGVYYKGLCPFHHEKTPSFTVRPEFYHCFGCGEHGDVFSFLQKIKQQAFVDIVKDLANDLGIELRGDVDDEYTKMQNILKDFVAAAQSKIGLSEVRDYIGRRGISEQSVKQFQLGFVTQDVLNKFSGVETDLKQKLGINFMLKDRLLFPIKNGGQLVGIGARILHDNLEHGPKYINSPDSVLFQKRRLLYGDGFFDNSHTSAAGVKKTLICEGYTDVILVSQASIISGTSSNNNGLEYVYRAVAPLGTAFTHEQLLRLWQIDKKPYICFDGDGAGRAATLKAAKLALQYLGGETSARIMTMPPGMDPAEVIQQFGLVKFKEYMEQAQELSEYIIVQTLDHAQTPEQVLQIKQELRQLLLSMQNRDARDIFAQFWKKKIEKKVFSLSAGDTGEKNANGDNRGFKSNDNDKNNRYRSWSGVNARNGFDGNGRFIERRLPKVTETVAPHLKILLGLIAVKPELLEYVYNEFIELELDERMSEAQQAILDGESGALVEEYGKYVKNLVEQLDGHSGKGTIDNFNVNIEHGDSKEYVALWLETYKLYRKSKISDELKELKILLEKEFAQETWDRIVYLNQMLMKD